VISRAIVVPAHDDDGVPPVRARRAIAMNSTCEAVRPLAPEDVRDGDVIVVMSRIVDAAASLDVYDLMMLAESQSTPALRRRILPEAPELLRVRGCSVPMVMTTTPTDEPRLLDLRQCSIGRVDRAFGDAAMAAMAAAAARAKAEAAADASTAGNGTGSGTGDGDDSAPASGSWWRRWRR